MTIGEWVEAHTKCYAECACGQKCFLHILIVCDHFVMISAKCRRCGKGLELCESSHIIDGANFNLVDKLIDKFKEKFKKPIEVEQ